jgi:predicted Zn-dependent peptidase
VHCQQETLSNGLTVLVAENPIADIIAARIFVRVGSRWESPEQFGLFHLMGATLSKGTQTLSAQEIAEKVEGVGAALGTDTAPDYFLLSLKAVSADFPALLRLAEEILRSPSFPESEVELEKKIALQAIRSQQEQPMAVATAQLRQSLYGVHPYAQSGLGTEETVAQLQREDLLQAHQQHFRPDNLVISLAGNITPEAGITLVEETFADWSQPASPLPTLTCPHLSSQPQICRQVQPTQQSIVMVGYLAPSIHDPDYVPLKLLSTYLGNGLSSRLFTELREQRGLAYEVSSFYPTRLDRSHFVVYMGTAADNTRIALESLQSEVQRLSQAPLTANEVQVTQSKILGQYALGKQTNAQIAQAFGWYETLGLGITYDQQFVQQIATITPQAIYEAATRYLQSAYVSIVGTETAIFFDS